MITPRRDLTNSAGGDRFVSSPLGVTAPFAMIGYPTSSSAEPRETLSDPILPSLRFHHLRALTGRHGLFEHAEFDAPRPSHGYTVDDNARALVVLGRMREGEVPRALVHRYREFVLSALTERGWRNRLSRHGRWTDQLGPEDTNGRALWGLAHTGEPMDERVAAAIDFGLTLDLHHLRANAYATLGAVELLNRHPEWPGADGALRRFVARLPLPGTGSWKWPAERLTYANARIPEAMIAAGKTLGDDTLVSNGLELLDWLIETERGELGFSFTPVGGRGAGEPRPGFDQQPIEAWAMADACERAFLVTNQLRYLEEAWMAALWFVGHNDVGASLYDPESGAGFDGLESDGVNLNRGAESTLAALGALQVVTPPRLVTSA